MVLWSKSKEVGKREGVKELSDFEKVDQALNQNGFSEFLARFPDYKSLEPTGSDLKLVLERHEAFKEVKETTRQLKRLYTQEIREDLGINLEETDLKAVDSFLEGEIIKNPSFVKGLKEQLEKFANLNKKISDRKLELEKMGGKGILDYQQSVLETAARKGGFKNMPIVRKLFSKDPINEARRAVQDDFGVPLKDIKAEQANIKQLRELREQFLQDMGAAIGLTKILQKKAKSQVAALLSSQSLEGAEEAYKFLEKAQRSAQDSGADITSVISESAINEQIEKSLKHDVAQAIEDSSSGSRSFANLEKALDGYVSKQSLGGRDKDQARGFVYDTIREIMDQQTRSKNNNPKLFQLKLFLAKLQHKWMLEGEAEDNKAA